MIIEDNPLIRSGQRMLLEDAGYIVVEIATSADLVRFSAAPGGSDAIIADFDLGPGMTGIDIAQEIMRLAGQAIPTLVLSASFGQRSLPASADAAMPVIFKPATEDQILDWLEAVLTPPGNGSSARESGPSRI